MAYANSESKVVLKYPPMEKGVKGKKVTLATNCFKIEWNYYEIYHYKVTFDPPISERETYLKKRTFFQNEAEIEKMFKIYHYDGGFQFFATEKKNEQVFKGKTCTITITPHEKNSPFGLIDFNNLNLGTEELDLANLVLNSFNHKLMSSPQRGWKRIGRKYYLPNPKILSDVGLQVFQGTECSVELCEIGSIMHINPMHRIIRHLNVYDEVFKNSRGRRQVEGTFANATVYCFYNNQLWRVDGIDWDKSPDSKFEMKGVMTSFRDYYKTRWNIRIKQNEPGLLFHRRKKTNDIVHLMPELCHVTGLSDREKKNYRLMKLVADTTKLKPESRNAFNNKIMVELKENPLIKQGKLPFSVGDTISVQGRLLERTKCLVSMNNKPVTVTDEGKFATALRTSDMMQPAICKKLVFFYCTANTSEFQTLMDQFKFFARGTMGKILGKPIIRYHESKGGLRDEDIANSFKTVLQKECPHVIVCLLPAEKIYDALKKACTCYNPACLSQMVKAQTLKNPKRVRAVCGNIFKQIATKIGGLPWKTDIGMEKVPTMVVGIDVCHEKSSGRSTAAFVASYSSDYCRYNSYLQHQKLSEEILNEPDKFMSQALDDFYNIWKIYPKRILIYRDGVSNSQMSKVESAELKGFRRAFAKYKDYDPKMTLVVVQKRVSQRFFQKTQRGWENPQPGTVIDSDITSSIFNDFYLISPSKTPSLITPTRYFIIVNEIGYSSDEIQAISSNFTWQYFNYSGPVRVPAPCMYAHKLAALFGKDIKDAVMPSKILQSRLYYL